MNQGGVIEGRLTDAATGKGLHGFGIRSSIGAAPTYAGENGYYSLRVYPGDNEVEAFRIKGYGGISSNYFSVTGKRNVSVAKGRKVEGIDFKFAKGLTVSGHIYDAKTNEPVREGVVAATGPFIDTIVICTITALVVLITGTLTRSPVAEVAAARETRSFEEDGVAKLALDVRMTVLDTMAAKVDETLFVHEPPDTAGAAAGKVQFKVSEVLDGEIVATATYDDNEKGRKALESHRARVQAGEKVFLFRTGVELTAYAFDQGFAGFGTYFIPIAAFMFAFSTIVTWGFYGETCTVYLFGERAVLPFKCVFVAMILVGTYSMELQPVLDWSDAMLGLMLVPNLIGTMFLAPVVMRATKDYFRRLKAGDFEDEMRRAAEARARMRNSGRS